MKQAETSPRAAAGSWPHAGRASPAARSASLGRVVGPALAGLFYDQWQASPFYFAALLMAAVFVMAINL